MKIILDVLPCERYAIHAHMYGTGGHSDFFLRVQYPIAGDPVGPVLEPSDLTVSPEKTVYTYFIPAEVKRVAGLLANPGKVSDFFIEHLPRTPQEQADFEASRNSAAIVPEHRPQDWD